MYYNCIITRSNRLPFWYIKYLFLLSYTRSLELSHLICTRIQNDFNTQLKSYFSTRCEVFVVLIFVVNVKLSSSGRNADCAVTQRWKIRCVTDSARSHLTSPQFSLS